MLPIPSQFNCLFVTENGIKISYFAVFSITYGYKLIPLN